MKNGIYSDYNEFVLAKNTYDELGRLKSTKTNNQNNLNVDYTYNVRSWLTGISNPLFSENLQYNYNGDISQLSNTNVNTYREYGYEYDDLSRLRWVTGDDDWMEYDYNKNGNICYIDRYVYHEPITTYRVDDVHFSYSGNQLKNFYDDGDTDGIMSPYDIKDYTDQTVEYTYNKNGAMTKDLNAGISDIQYNLLNLPAQIDIKSPVAEAREHYYYTAAGEKLAAVHRWNPNYSTNPLIGSAVNTSGLSHSSKVEYIKNMEYNKYGNALKVKYDNGYYSYESSKNYVYIKDHLGNVRVVADKDGNVAQRTDYDPFGMIMSSSTNQSVQAYKYNGKEFMAQAGLNIYDYGARPYDPARIQFWTIDPLAEKYPWLSPYAYCANNPVKYVDPNGEDLYLFYYMDDNYENGQTDDKSNRMFWAAALTRAMDIARNLKDGDKAVFKSISSTSDFKSTIEGDVAANKNDYGPTKEVGIWSHGGFDGPLRHPQDGPNDQLPVSDWSNIDFNWSSDDASIGFYGCQTGRVNKKTGQAFNEILSGYDNFSNVDVWGQTSRSWPSPYTNYRYATPAIQSSNHGYPTYMVGSHKGIMGFLTRYSPIPASVMSIFRNGTLQGYGYQSGKRLK